MPGEHAASRVEKRAPAHSATAKARPNAASRAQATFAERIDAFAVAPATHDTFDPPLEGAQSALSLAYAPATGFGPFAPANDAFELRDSITDGARPTPQTRSTPQNSAHRSSAALATVPLPPARPATTRRAIRGDAAMRLASLDPFVALPAGQARQPSATPKTTDIPALVTAYAEKHGVPVPLAHAVVRVESNYKPHVTGKGATFGLMQIKYPTARGMGFKGAPKDLYDPATNLEWGMRYLAGARRLAKNDLCGTILRYQGGHYSRRMTRAASVYCAKVRAYMAESAGRRGVARAASAQ